MAVAATVDSTPWLTAARKDLGLKEIVGSKHEARILRFFAEAGHPNVKDDETSWCAAFVNAKLVEAGFAGTGSLLARSFLTWGTKLDGPKVGAVAVFRRGKEPWQGHVAIVVGEGIDTVRVLGGNQGNAVNVISMPKADVLGYRWPLIRASAPAKKETPTETAKKVGGAIVGGAVVVKTGEQAVAASANWSWLEIAAAVGGVVLLAGLVWLVWRWWCGRGAEPVPATPEIVDTDPLPISRPSLANRPLEYLHAERRYVEIQIRDADENQWGTARLMWQERLKEVDEQIAKLTPPAKVTPARKARPPTVKPKPAKPAKPAAKKRRA